MEVIEEIMKKKHWISSSLDDNDNIKNIDDVENLSCNDHWTWSGMYLYTVTSL